MYNNLYFFLNPLSQFNDISYVCSTRNHISILQIFFKDFFVTFIVDKSEKNKSFDLLDCQTCLYIHHMFLIWLSWDICWYKTENKTFKIAIKYIIIYVDFCQNISLKIKWLSLYGFFYISSYPMSYIFMRKQTHFCRTNWNRNIWITLGKWKLQINGRIHINYTFNLNHTN